jgi:hypothetical protein
MHLIIALYTCSLKCLKKRIDRCPEESFVLIRCKAILKASSFLIISVVRKSKGDFAEMPMMGFKFGTAINCIDGRTQEVLIDYMKQKFSIDGIDLVTFPGMDGVVLTGDAETKDIWRCLHKGLQGR